MSEVKSLDQIQLILVFLVPGLIILWIRSQFLTGRMIADKDALLSYLTISILYHGMTWQFLSNWVLSGSNLAWLVQGLLGPLIVGVILGVLAATGWCRNVLQWMGIRLVHPLPTAWDYCFTRPSAGLVEVTLKDGSRISGWLRPGDSFASSTGKDHDLFIGNVFFPDESGNLNRAKPPRSAYIGPGEIRLIMFFGQIGDEQ